MWVQDKAYIAGHTLSAKIGGGGRWIIFHNDKKKNSVGMSTKGKMYLIIQDDTEKYCQN